MESRAAESDDEVKKRNRENFAVGVLSSRKAHDCKSKVLVFFANILCCNRIVKACNKT
jgi:hypothetical protein